MQGPDMKGSPGHLSIAKITAPRLSAIFPRQRLYCHLDRAAERPVVWVCAPPGAGKTTLVASWLAERRISAIWYQIDEGDTDPASFFHYMGMALKQAAPASRKPFPHFTPEYHSSIRTVTRRYFEMLFSHLKSPCTIVFDNYQEASPESPIHEVLLEAMNVAPPGVNTIFISRNSPPATMATLKAGRRLANIGWDELRLTLDETAGIAAIHDKEGINEGSICCLHEMAQGWATGIILLMERFPLDYERNSLAVTYDLLEVFDYFAEEILAKISPDIKEFLLKSSLFPKMTAIMAEKLTGFAGSERILTHLVRNNYFTQKHPYPEPIYQYHPLFREFLLSQAKESFPSMELKWLRRHAAALLSSKGEMEAALMLLREADDWDGVTRLLNDQAQSLMAQGRINTIEKWLTAVPVEMTEHAVWPLYWLALCRLPFAPLESRVLFERAFHLFRRSRETFGAIIAWAGGVESFLYLMDDFTPLDEWICRLNAVLGNTPSFSVPEIEAHVAAGMTGALVWRHPHHPDMGKWVARSLALTTGISDVNLLIKLYASITQYLIWMGEFGSLRAILQQVETIAQTQPDSPMLMIRWKCIEASILSATTTTSEQILLSVTEGLKIARENGVHLWDQMLYAHGVYYALNEGHLAMADEYLEMMEATVNFKQRNTVAHLNFLQAWCNLLLGNISQALVHAEKGVELAVATGTPVPEIYMRLSRSLILHESGEAGKGMAELLVVKQLVRRTGSLFFEYLSHLTEALFSLGAGRDKKGVNELRKAMALGRKQGYTTLMFWWLPAHMARLCARALEEGIEVDYVCRLIRKLRLVARTPSTYIDSWPWPLKIYTLGRFMLAKDGVPVDFSGKVQEKPLALLKAIIALGGRNVAEERLSDLLWPNADGDAAYRSLATNLHRLRKLLAHDQALFVHGGMVSLNSRVVWVDALAFAGLTSEGHTPGCPERLLVKALALYGGNFLAGDKAAHWAVSMRERLRSKLIRIVTDAGSRLEEAGEWEKAIACYEKGLKTDDLIEEFYQRLMVCYCRLGKRGNALSLYQRCCHVLAMLGIKPSAVTRAIYEEVTNDSIL